MATNLSASRPLSFHRVRFPASTPIRTRSPASHFSQFVRTIPVDHMCHISWRGGQRNTSLSGPSAPHSRVNCWLKENRSRLFREAAKRCRERTWPLPTWQSGRRYRMSLRNRSSSISSLDSRTGQISAGHSPFERYFNFVPTSCEEGIQRTIESCIP